MSEKRLVSTLPSAPEVRDRIGQLLRELHLARRLLTLAELADRYRDIERPEAFGVGVSGA